MLSCNQHTGHGADLHVSGGCQHRERSASPALVNTLLGSGHSDAQYKTKSVGMNLPLSGFDDKCVGVSVDVPKYQCERSRGSVSVLPTLTPSAGKCLSGRPE